MDYEKPFCPIFQLKKQAENARSCEQILRSAAVAVFSLDLKSALAILRTATTNARNKGKGTSTSRNHLLFKSGSLKIFDR